MIEKRVIFNMPIKKYADLRIRLRHDGLKQYQLYNWLTDKYLSNEEAITGVVKELKYSIAKQGKIKIRKTDELIEAGRLQEQQFGLTKGDIENIYDIIEGELPEV